MTSADLEDRARALALVPVSRETIERFEIYADLLKKWQKVTNLVSSETVPLTWTRHLADSAQLIGHAPRARRWIDFGSGAGFPGIVIAIQLSAYPDACVYCIDVDRKKCAFMREVVRATGAPAVIHCGPVEDLRLKPVDAVTARAFASWSDTMKLARPYIDRGAIGVFPRGRSGVHFAADTPSSDPQPYTVNVIPSLTDEQSSIITISMKYVTTFPHE